MNEQANAAKPREDVFQITIDGRALEVPKKPGLTIIQVCDAEGIEVPRFCYHPHLTIPANCRMCLVEVEGAPKLMPACHTGLRDGMVVHTRSDRVKAAQEAVLEFLLVNHPVDCPICDQAGECPLQDQYFKYDRRPSRVGDPVRKVKKAKHVQVGPRVTLDQERCVLCTRCIRFMDEVAKEPQLGMFWRNDHAYVDTFPGQPLTSNYSLNTVAICPVGALTSTDFRFRKRVWNLKSAPTLCDGCARGCNAWVDRDRDGNEVYRYRARENEAVNRVWMCDQGFLSYKAHNERRVLAAREGRGAAAKVGRSYEVAARTAERLRTLEGEAGLLVSACASTEDILATLWVAREVFGLSRVYEGGREEGEQDRILLRADRNPNRLGLQIVAEAFGFELLPFDALLEAVDDGKVKALWAVGDEVPVDAQMAAGLFSSLDFFGVQARHRGPLTEVADVVLPAATHASTTGPSSTSWGGCSASGR
ncbi:MAG: ferredoxin [Deltaproteobacteria bacterium]|nr:MAG: ferredoxin [Deltaproteobacteria bacterium]